VQPDWANGAILLVPVTEQQIVEADIELKAHNILMLASDVQLVKDALAQLVKRKRPGLKPEHYPHGKPEHASDAPKSSSMQSQQPSTQELESSETVVHPLPGDGMLQSQAHPVGSWMRDVGIVVERTFLHFPIEKDISEASIFVHSAPDGETAASECTAPQSNKERMNPHKWQLSRASDER
jgi:hypothetical protein